MPVAEVLYDPSRPEFQDTLWDVYRTMRDDHPVYRSPDGEFYALTRFADVWAAANDHETFSSRVAEANDLLPQLIYLDPPRHSALRRLVSRVFTARRVALMEDEIRTYIHQLLDDIAERGECEFQHDYAAVIPSVVVGRMIGIDDEYIAPMRTWTEAFISGTGEDGLTAAVNIYAMFAELLAERRRNPREDMITALTTAEVDGERLTEEELLGFCLLLVLGGNDTTASLIGSAMVMLQHHAAQRHLLQRDPSLWPAAIEEINRIESPTQTLPRNTTRDITLHGIDIPAGSRVMLVWGAANHDEREFDNPERFDICRSAKRHISFGHGVHACMGSGLARLEARLALTEWFDRFPNCELTSEPERVTSIWARAYHSIPLSWS
ncbi:putative cytochrome P450 hydroxylase [Mycolicibacterium fortuitum]|uniref:Steroid C26-monooxygenase n=1 Tax=Mycolicibacterium fortuitum TaxID=1766 RepID=A0A0N9XBT6_MYCFO|nr:cytochrome P450 [Mycolicibacterium fortuitum]ALI24653.1 putative cytochrome P450 hydroxylase [Mycolicibacterium fortuitum]